MKIINWVAYERVALKDMTKEQLLVVIENLSEAFDWVKRELDRANNEWIEKTESLDEIEFQMQLNKSRYEDGKIPRTDYMTRRGVLHHRKMKILAQDLSSEKTSNKEWAKKESKEESELAKRKEDLLSYAKRMNKLMKSNTDWFHT